MAKRLLGQSDLTLFQLDVARGVFPNVHWVDKFGENTDIDIGSPETLIWGYGPTQPAYPYPEWGVAPITHIVSSESADTAFPIAISGLDIEGYFVEQTVLTHPSDGSVAVELDTPLWRCWRMRNADQNLTTGQGRSLAGQLYATDGLVVGADNVWAVINDGQNQTQMCTYTIPKGLVGYLMEGEAGLSKSGSITAAGLCYKSRRFGGAFTTKKTFSAASGGSSYFQDERQVWDVLPELTDVELCCQDVSSNNTSVWGTFDILLIDEAAETAEVSSTIIAGLR